FLPVEEPDPEPTTLPQELWTIQFGGEGTWVYGVAVGTGDISYVPLNLKLESGDSEQRLVAVDENGVIIKDVSLNLPLNGRNLDIARGSNGVLHVIGSRPTGTVGSDLVGSYLVSMPEHALESQSK